MPINSCIFGSVEDGLQFFEALARASNPETDDLIFLARIYEWFGLTGEAFEILDCRLAGLHYWRIHWCRAQFLLRKNRLLEAIEAAEESVRLAPDRPDPLDVLALIYTTAGDPEQAVATKAKAERVFQREIALAELDAE